MRPNTLRPFRRRMKIVAALLGAVLAFAVAACWAVQTAGAAPAQAPACATIQAVETLVEGSYRVTCAEGQLAVSTGRPARVPALGPASVATTRGGRGFVLRDQEGATFPIQR